MLDGTWIPAYGRGTLHTLISVLVCAASATLANANGVRTDDPNGANGAAWNSDMFQRRTMVWQLPGCAGFAEAVADDPNLKRILDRAIPAGKWNEHQEMLWRIPLREQTVRGAVAAMLQSEVRASPYVVGTVSISSTGATFVTDDGPWLRLWGGASSTKGAGLELTREMALEGAPRKGVSRASTPTGQWDTEYLELRVCHRIVVVAHDEAYGFDQLVVTSSRRYRLFASGMVQPYAQQRAAMRAHDVRTSEDWMAWLEGRLEMPLAYHQVSSVPAEHAEGMAMNWERLTPMQWERLGGQTVRFPDGVSTVATGIAMVPSSPHWLIVPRPDTTKEHVEALAAQFVGAASEERTNIQWGQLATRGQIVLHRGVSGGPVEVKLVRVRAKACPARSPVSGQ